jgi:hypothetical protein
MTIKKEIAGTAILKAVPLRCKSWSCPICSEKKSNSYGKRIADSFGNQQLYFYTFTFYHSMDSLSCWKNQSKAWNHLLTILHKHYGRFSYVKVLESHRESPYPHLHVLTKRLFGAVILGQALVSAGFGYQSRVARVQSVGVSSYLRKYLGKSWTRADSSLLRKKLALRIVCFSRGACNSAHLHSGWSFIGISQDRDSAIVRLLMAAAHYSGNNWFADKQELSLPLPQITCNIPPPHRPQVRPDGPWTLPLTFFDAEERKRLVLELGLTPVTNTPDGA